MHSVRLPLWVHPLLFGRRIVARDAPATPHTLPSELKLFALTYAAGFAFTTLWLA